MNPNSPLYKYKLKTKNKGRHDLELCGDGTLTDTLEPISVNDKPTVLSLSKNRLKVEGELEIKSTKGINISKDGHIKANKSICFEQTAAFTRTTATYVDFGVSNKASIEMDGNITSLQLIPPPGSASLILRLTQDGTGSRTVAIWAGSDGTVLKWAGGTTPTLTTTANKSDIIAFYYDNSTKEFYGQASLNF